MLKYIPLIGILVLLGAFLWGAVKYRDRFVILSEFVEFLRERKLWWIIPLVVVFALAGLFIVFTLPVSGFIYTLF